MNLHIIGTGCPDARKQQYGSAFGLEIGGDLLLVDCGPATTYKMARMGLKETRVGHVFLTHHHFDHNADVPCFVLTRWDQSRGTEAPLQLYGPPPTERFADLLFGTEGAFAPDLQARVDHPASHECHQMRHGIMPRPGLKLDAHDVDSGMVADAAAWSCTAARVHHVEPCLISLAYRFNTDEGSVVFAGDCGDCNELREFAQGADTLVIACTHFGPGSTRPSVADVITGTPEVSAIANEAGVGRVVLTHTSPGYEKPGVKERAVAEIARSYDGAIIFPDELQTVQLPNGG
jgi:ribonuclease BN (tRNA processing enzyme)